VIRIEFFETRDDYEAEPRLLDAPFDVQTIDEALERAKTLIENNPRAVVALGM